MRLEQPQMRHYKQVMLADEDFEAAGEEPYCGLSGRIGYGTWLTLIRRQAQPSAVQMGYNCNQIYFMTDDEGVICGFGQLRPIDTEDVLTWAGHIGYSVPPSLRGRGYATQLLRMLLEEAFRRGVRDVQQRVAASKVIGNRGTVVQPDVRQPGTGPGRRGVPEAGGVGPAVLADDQRGALVPVAELDAEQVVAPALLAVRHLREPCTGPRPGGGAVGDLRPPFGAPEAPTGGGLGGGRDIAHADGPALRLVRAQQARTAPSVQRSGELPCQVDGVPGAGVHAEPAGGDDEVRGVTGEEHPPGPVPGNPPIRTLAEGPWTQRPKTRSGGRSARSSSPDDPVADHELIVGDDGTVTLDRRQRYPWAKPAIVARWKHRASSTDDAGKVQAARDAGIPGPAENRVQPLSSEMMENQVDDAPGVVCVL